MDSMRDYKEYLAFIIQLYILFTCLKHILDLVEIYFLEQYIFRQNVVLCICYST